MNGDDLDVAQCLQRVREQDPEAARVLVERLYPLIIRIVRSHLPVRTAEEDLAQEVFAKLFAHLDQYEERRGVPFAHWVSRLAVRTCLDALRAERRRPELRWADLPDEQAEWLQFMLAEETPPPEASPASARELLEKLMAQLPPADRFILHALDLEEKPVKQIAAFTGWSVTLVKVRAFRARRKLRKLALAFKENHPHETL